MRAARGFYTTLLISASFPSGPARCECPSLASPGQAPAAIQVEFLPAGTPDSAAPSPRCFLEQASTQYLATLENQLATHWSLPVGWHPFPSAEVRFSISEQGAVHSLSLLTASSAEYGSCAAAALAAVAAAPLPPPPPCLCEAPIAARFLIPFNTLGPVRGPSDPVAPPQSVTDFEAQDLPPNLLHAPIEPPAP
jgi:hypothetical protein